MVHQQQTHIPNPDNNEVYAQNYSKYQQILMSNLQELAKHI